MAEQNKLWVVEEVDVGNGNIAQRQTIGMVANADDGSWCWVKPDERLTDPQKIEWDRVMNLLKNVNGEDLRHLTCFAGMLNHCTSAVLGENDYFDPATDA